MIIERRSFLKGISVLFIAPAIIRAENLMPIREYAPAVPDWCPDGWLPLDGREITKKFYPDLHSAYARMRYSHRLSMQEPYSGSDGSQIATIISAKDLRRANGSIMRAGVCHDIIIPAQAA